MTTATFECVGGCFTIEYRESIENPDVDGKDFLNELGPPIGVRYASDSCPNCGSTVTVDWNGKEVVDGE